MKHKVNNNYVPYFSCTLLLQNIHENPIELIRLEKLMKHRISLCVMTISSVKYMKFAFHWAIPMTSLQFIGLQWKFNIYFV